MSIVGNEYPRALKWLYETLTDPAITTIDDAVYEHPGPGDSPDRAITYALQAPDDLVVVGEERVWAEFLMLVAVRDKTESTYSLKDVADEIDVRLHGTDGPVDEHFVISSTRIAPFHAAELVDGVPYRRLGGIYSLLVQPANP